MLKKPSNKKVMDLGVSLLALEGGRMASRAVTPAIPGVSDRKIQQLIVAGIGLAVALAYNGPQKDKVQPFFAGMALEQGGAAKDTALQSALPADTNDTKAVGYLRKTYGLNGCGCDTGYSPSQMLNGITAIDWDNDQYEYTEYQEVGAPGV